ncbi:YkvA family protein [Desulfosporosinus sp. BICA1-9]|uniref:YkvA family protein n=1 Tax=Desulfosporosinus sp. BICA1-9 TaxID=1531958 RepID=UPI000A9EAE56|nr:YkvA family protein [Desulfosporosinus sp. BICA1-9]
MDMKLEKKRLAPFKAKANEYLKDKKKSLGLLNEALQKATTNRTALGETWEKLQLLFGVLRDWINGNYKEMPKRSLLIIVLGIVYFVSPLDGIFDYIPFAGLVDDAAVAGFVITQVSVDLDRYKLWKKQVESGIESDQPDS